MFIAFIIIMFGILFAHRTLVGIAIHNTLSQDMLTKIGTVYLLLVSVPILFTSHSDVLLWCGLMIPPSVLWCACRIVRRRREIRFSSGFIESLNVLIMKMKAGKSFRQSLAELIAECDRVTASKLTEVRDVVVFSQQTTSRSGRGLINEVVEVFEQTDRQPQGAVRRLVVFRDRLKLIDDFRRRSGQASRQVRTQALVLTVLYIAVLLFVARNFGWSPNTGSLSVSVLLFVVGLFCMILLSRKRRWKI